MGDRRLSNSLIASISTRSSLDESEKGVVGEVLWARLSYSSDDRLPSLSMGEGQFNPMTSIGVNLIEEQRQRTHELQLNPFWLI